MMMMLRTMPRPLPLSCPPASGQAAASDLSHSYYLVVRVRVLVLLAAVALVRLAVVRKGNSLMISGTTPFPYALLGAWQWSDWSLYRRPTSLPPLPTYLYTFCSFSPSPSLP